MLPIQPKKHVKELTLAVVSQMLALATSGFGLVAARAWNEVIKQFIEDYVKPYLGKGSGIVSLLIYAVGVTILAVAITVQLSKIQNRLKN